MEQVFTDKAPKAIGPYSQAVVHNGILYCSGQIAINPETGNMEEADIIVQAERVMKNIGEILKSGNSGFEKVLKATVYLKNMTDFATVNEIYARYFISKPARAAFEVSNLPKNALIEIECIAYI